MEVSHTNAIWNTLSIVMVWQHNSFVFGEYNLLEFLSSLIFIVHLYIETECR